MNGGVQGMEESPTFHIAVAMELFDPNLPFPERWDRSNIRNVKVIDAAPYRKGQFNWSTVPEWGAMERALFGK